MEQSEMFPNKFFRKHLKMFKTFFPNISGNNPEHCELFSNIFSLDTLKIFSNLFGNILKSSNGTFWNVSKQIIQKSFFPNISSNYPEHCELFSNIYSLWHFWMFRNILKSSNGTFWNYLNVHEHFKNFQWNILKF